MKTKTVLITGASQGIGRATALALAQQGAAVVIVSRNRERGRAVAEEVAARGASRSELIVADLSSQAQVRAAAGEFLARSDRLDVLVNNAGVFVPQRRVTSDGLEETFAVNHLAYFLLTRELLGVLRASAPARIVNVSSDAHRHGRMHWSDLQYRSHAYSAWGAYAQSKLANLLFTYELARRLAGTGVTANALHPGVVASGFGQTYPGPMALLYKIGGPFMLSPEKGARTSICLASAPEVEGVTGKYFVRCHAAKSSGLSYCEASGQKLWALSERMVEDNDTKGSDEFASMSLDSRARAV